ncbi:MAG TPA: ATP-binding cassette domain-containing protein [Geobacteraceae bacterium]|nr:ATP-binding cassette domain-containing protein [Geobacteraceae bacterium]
MLNAAICKKFPGFTVEVEFAFEQGILVLFGPSGSGKTTVLNCLSGLVRPDSGAISLGDRIFFSSVQGIDVPVRKRRTGYVFQHYALFPHMTVKDNVLYGVPGRHKMKVKDRYRMSVLEVLEMLKITRLQDRYPSELSGGEKQRVALARALMVEPELLLLDEPLSAVDHAMRKDLRQELRQLQRIWRIPFVLVTHSREEMKVLADEVLFMKAGRKTSHVDMAAKRSERGLLSGEAEDERTAAKIYPFHAKNHESPVHDL